MTFTVKINARPRINVSSSNLLPHLAPLPPPLSISQPIPAGDPALSFEPFVGGQDVRQVAREAADVHLLSVPSGEKLQLLPFVFRQRFHQLLQRKSAGSAEGSGH